MDMIFTKTNILFLLQGLKLTLIIAVISIFLSMIFGTILAVLRNYSKGIFGKLAAIYIEIFRNTPSLLWILSIRFLIPIKPMYSGILSFTLFTTAAIAEIVRGGMNSVNAGQYEASYSQGFSKIQTLRYIILPQSFKKLHTYNFISKFYCNKGYIIFMGSWNRGVYRKRYDFDGKFCYFNSGILVIWNNCSKLFYN